MHDSRGAALKVGDRVLVEAKVTALASSADPNFCNVTIEVVTPEQRDTTPMVPPTISAINTKMLTKVAAILFVAFLMLLPKAAAADPASLPSGFDPNLDRRVQVLEAKVQALEATAAKYGYRSPVVAAKPPLVASTSDPLRGLTVEELKQIDPWYTTPDTCPGGKCQAQQWPELEQPTGPVRRFFKRR